MWSVICHLSLSSSGTSSLQCISAGPCLPGAIRLRRVVLQITFIPDFYQRFFNNCYLMTYRSADLCFEGLQVSNLGLVTVVLYPLDKGFTTHLARSLSFGWFWWDPEIHEKFNACAVTQQNTKLVPQDPPKWPKWGSNRCLKSFKSAKSEKSVI